MNKSFLFSICSTLILLLFVSFSSPTSEECDVVAFYKAIDSPYGSKAIDSYGEVIDVETLLVRTERSEVKPGKYRLSATRKADNIYKINEVNLYIETQFCFEYAVFDDIVLVVDSYGSGKVIFIE